eukprot:c24817_g1_i1 orf=263-1990(+)
MSENISDEQAVVGEPVSHPHQAVVVGEPPEGMPPVLGEPVLLSNGVGDRQPISPPSADETSVNGIQTPAPLDSGFDAPPASQSSSELNSSSAAPSEDNPNLHEVAIAEEHSPSESRDGGAPVVEGERRSDVAAPESIHPSEPHVNESPSELDAPAVESTNAVDAPAESAPDTHDASHSTAEEPASDIPDVVEVTHIADTPSEGLPPACEFHTENPFQALDEASGDNEKASGESLASEDSVTDQTTADAPVTDQVSDANAQASDVNVYTGQDETTSKELGACDASQQEEDTILLSASQGELSTGHLASTQTAVDGNQSEESKEYEPVKEEPRSVEADQASQENVSIQESDASKPKFADAESGSSEVEHSLGVHPPEQAIESHASVQENDASVQQNDVSVQEKDPSVPENDATVQENDTRGEIPVKPEMIVCGVEQVLSRETPISEVLIEESPSSQKDVLHSAHVVPESEKTPAEAAPVDSPVVSHDTRAISVDNGFVDEPTIEVTSLPPAANGDNGFHHVEDGNHPLEREQDLSKDDEESAEEKEKPSSFLKMPLIVTGLAIAAVGVAVASFSRPH